MKEKVSALMDGELDAHAAGEAIDGLREGEALQAWRTYHLIGDAMRDARVLSEGFTARVSQRLAVEPTVLMPARLPARPVQRFALAAAASLAAASLVGWLAFAPQPEAPAPIAQVKPAAAVAQVLPVVTVVPFPNATNDYLLAHQGFSPRVSFQGMAPYVRTVADRADEKKQ